MRRLALLLLTATRLYAGGWVSLAPPIVPRQEIAAVAAVGKIYILGGIDANRQGIASVEEYDPATNAWRTRAPMPRPLHHPAAAAIGGAIYVIGGYDGQTNAPTSAVHRYDIAGNQWTAVASLPSPRAALAAVTIGGKIYAVGGVPGSGRELTVYDPATNAWTARAPMPTPREHLAAATDGAMLYVAGGRFPANTNAFERFDPASGTWTALPPLPTARGGLAAAALHGRIYVFGGEGNRATATGVFAEVESFEVATSTWRREEDMLTPRHGIGAVTLGERIHIPSGSPFEGFGTAGVHDAFVARPSRRRAVRR